MPEKDGKGGHGLENYDPETGKYVADGEKNETSGSLSNSDRKVLNSMGLSDDDFKREVIEGSKEDWVKTPEDEKVWNSLSDDEKYLLGMSNDMGFWGDEISDNEESKKQYDEISSKFSKNQSMGLSKKDVGQDRSELGTILSGVSDYWKKKGGPNDSYFVEDYLKEKGYEIEKTDEDGYYSDGTYYLDEISELTPFKNDDYYYYRDSIIRLKNGERVYVREIDTMDADPVDLIAVTEKDADFSENGNFGNQINTKKYK